MLPIAMGKSKKAASEIGGAPVVGQPANPIDAGAAQSPLSNGPNAPASVAPSGPGKQQAAVNAAEAGDNVNENLKRAKNALSKTMIGGGPGVSNGPLSFNMIGY